jgi:hypothetical protein
VVHLVTLVLVAALRVVETGDGVADAMAEVNSVQERRRSAPRRGEVEGRKRGDLPSVTESCIDGEGQS